MGGYGQYYPVTWSRLGKADIAVTVVLPPSTRGSGHEPSRQRQRRLITSQDMARNRLTDIERLVLSHFLGTRTMALPGLVLGGNMALKSGSRKIEESSHTFGVSQ